MITTTEPAHTFRPALSSLVTGITLLVAGCLLDRPPEQQADSATRFFVRATQVHDGDSFAAQRRDGQRVQIRIGAIDAPEKGQPHADEARSALASLISDKTLEVRPSKVDRFGRTVATVLADGTDIGLAMVERGLAWHFGRFEGEQKAADAERYRQAQRAAQSRSAGLWGDPQPQAPWRFRDQRPGAAGSAAGTARVRD